MQNHPQTPSACAALLRRVHGPATSKVAEESCFPSLLAGCDELNRSLRQRSCSLTDSAALAHEFLECIEREARDLYEPIDERRIERILTYCTDAAKALVGCKGGGPWTSLQSELPKLSFRFLSLIPLLLEDYERILNFALIVRRHEPLSALN